MSKLMTYEADLNEAPVKPQEFKSPLYLGEKNAHTIRVNLKSTEAVPADATCEGYFIYLDTQQTVKIPEAKCSYSNGVAEVTLTPDCYQIVSRVSFIMALGNLADKIVILNLAGRVISSWTDIVVESGDLENIPDLQTLVDMINAVNHLDISSSKSGRIITIATTDRHGATQSSTITEPTATVTKEQNGPYHLTVTDVNGTTVVDIPDPAAEVKKKANRSSVTADRTISGAGKVEFPDALDEPMSLNLKLEPKQDLHGHDKPWVGGAGKNLLDSTFCTDRTQNGITTARNSDGSIKLTGTWGGNRYWNSSDTLGLTLSAGTYTLTSHVFLEKTAGGTVKDTFTLSETTTFKNAGFTGYSSGATVDETIYPQLESGSTASAYEPYSNICPITGYDAVEVVSTGKNLVNASSSNVVYYQNYNNFIVNNGVVTVTGDSLMGFVVPVKPLTTYTASYNPSSTGLQMRVREYSARPITWEDNGFVIQSVNSANIVNTFTTSSTTRYIIFGMYSGNGRTIDNWQLELGSVATPYEPFGSSLTLNLTSAAGGTVYGGTVTVNDDGSGELVVDKAKVLGSQCTWSANASANTFNGAHTVAPVAIANDTTGFSSAYIQYRSDQVTSKDYGFATSNNSRTIFVKNKDFNDVSAFTTHVANVEFVYDITPQSYPLTASQINSLLGYTQVITDTDGALTVGYKTDKYAKYPDVPSTDGLYILAVNMSNGAPSYSWGRLS